MAFEEPCDEQFAFAILMPPRRASFDNSRSFVLTHQDAKQKQDSG